MGWNSQHSNPKPPPKTICYAVTVFQTCYIVWLLGPVLDLTAYKHVNEIHQIEAHVCLIAGQAKIIVVNKLSSFPFYQKQESSNKDQNLVKIPGDILGIKKHVLVLWFLKLNLVLPSTIKTVVQRDVVYLSWNHLEFLVLSLSFL